MQYRKSSYAANVFDTFYFEKNLHGDIIAIYNESGRKILEYTYDAWGNHSVTWTYLTMETLPAGTNPFRYRGYYYDTDTGLYYLQSRYYNPQWGRFLNADGYVNANGDLIGFNMYAYCSNNPVIHSDPSGKRKISLILAELFLYYTADSDCLLIKLLADKVRVDVYGKDNRDANVIVSAHWFSYYENTLVIKNPIEGINSFAIGNTIYVSKDFNTYTPDDQAQILKHEYGHILQEKDLGRVKYFVSVAIPSVLYCGFSRMMREKYDITYFSELYYSMPWEYKANENSNIVSNVKPWAKVVSDLYYAFWKGEEKQS